VGDPVHVGHDRNSLERENDSDRHEASFRSSIRPAGFEAPPPTRKRFGTTAQGSVGDKVTVCSVGAASLQHMNQRLRPISIITAGNTASCANGMKAR